MTSAPPIPHARGVMASTSTPACHLHCTREVIGGCRQRELRPHSQLHPRGLKLKRKQVDNVQIAQARPRPSLSIRRRHHRQRVAEELTAPAKPVRDQPSEQERIGPWSRS